MISRHRLAEVAALIADPSRAAMLSALENGRALPAGDLARAAGVSAATASAHLAKLRASGLVRLQPHGRYRYFRLAGHDVAEALESLARLLPPRAPLARSAPERALAAARLCYDHLAGGIGVALTDALIERRALDLAGGRLQLGSRAGAVCARVAIDLDALALGRRALLRTCLDWTERREHVGGALGAAIAASGFERRWFERVGGSRALRVTDRGRHDLTRDLGVRWTR
jgi:DNA-binding transcriptional ArsR family regulator